MLYLTKHLFTSNPIQYTDCDIVDLKHFILGTLDKRVTLKSLLCSRPCKHVKTMLVLWCNKTLCHIATVCFNARKDLDSMYLLGLLDSPAV